MSGEVVSFNSHCSAFITEATCHIWWKFVNRKL